MEQPTGTFRRGVFEFLGESFAIYGRHWRKFILIAFILQLPMSAVEAAISDSLPTLESLQALQADLANGNPDGEVTPQQTDGEPQPNSIDGIPLGEIVSLFRIMLLYLAFASVISTVLNGTFTSAVGQQYVAGTVDVGGSYSRAWWRVLSLAILGLIMFAAITLMLIGIVFIVPAIVMIVALVYWSVAAQAVVIEGCKPIEAMRRSWRLVRGYWWRTFGAWALVGLVSFGLAVLLGVVLIAPINLIGSMESGILATVVEVLSGIVTGVIITPILGIAGALIYFDLRSRKEEYDLEALSEQIGIPPAGNAMT